jgi:hypothetical protein
LFVYKLSSAQAARCFGRPPVLLIQLIMLRLAYDLSNLILIFRHQFTDFTAEIPAAGWELAKNFASPLINLAEYAVLASVQSQYG